jgi:hypothetical protein
MRLGSALNQPHGLEPFHPAIDRCGMYLLAQGPHYLRHGRMAKLSYGLVGPQQRPFKPGMTVAVAARAGDGRGSHRWQDKALSFTCQDSPSPVKVLPRRNVADQIPFGVNPVNRAVERAGRVRANYSHGLFLYKRRPQDAIPAGAANMETNNRTKP